MFPKSIKIKLVINISWTLTIEPNLLVSNTNLGSKLAQSFDRSLNSDSFENFNSLGVNLIS